MSDTNVSAIATDNMTSAEAEQRVMVLTMTLGTAGQIYATVPWGCTLTSVQTSISAALATGNETLTVKNAAGSSAGTIVIAQSGSAAGDQDSLTPSSNNTFAAGDNIEIETDGGNSVAAVAHITLLLSLT